METTQNIVLYFLNHCAKHANEPAIIFIENNGRKKVYTWGDYLDQSVAFAKGLKHRARKGAFVAIVPLNLPESFFALMGTILYGAIPVPINALLLLDESGRKELLRILENCNPDLIVTNDSNIKHIRTSLLQQNVESRFAVNTIDWIIGRYSLGQKHISTNIIRDVNGDVLVEPHDFLYGKKDMKEDVLIMPYTSGTTGGPKGVKLSYLNIFSSVRAVTGKLGITADERILSYLSLGHISDLVATFFGQMYAGYQVYFTEYAGLVISQRDKFREKLPWVLRQVKPTAFMAVPKIWDKFKKEIEDKTGSWPLPASVKRWFVKKKLGLDKARLFVSAGSWFDPRVSKFFNDFLGIRIRDIYGQTETAGPLLVDGELIDHNSVLYLTNKDEICVNGDNVMIGYYANLEANENVFTDTYDPTLKREISRRYLLTMDTKVYKTGDLGRERELHKIEYIGRMRDGTKLSNGEFVTPEEISKLERQIKNIDESLEEAIVCGDGCPYLVALIFSHKHFCQALHSKIQRNIIDEGIGRGLTRIGGFMLLDRDELEMTPTLKTKRVLMIQKFNPYISNIRTTRQAQERV